jgi:flagellar motor switch protein FliN/FliY
MSKETNTQEPSATDSSAEPDASGSVSTNAQSNATIRQQQPPGEGYEPVEFDDMNSEAAARRPNGDANLDVILDIPVTLSMEIGRTRVSIQDLLQLARGSVVELDRMAGEPLDVLVNGTLVARGEVVVVNDKFGVRLSDVISPADRVNSIR